MTMMEGVKCLNYILFWTWVLVMNGSSLPDSHLKTALTTLKLQKVFQGKIPRGKQGAEKKIAQCEFKLVLWASSSYILPI